MCDKRMIQMKLRNLGPLDLGEITLLPCSSVRFANGGAFGALLHD